MLEKEEFIRRFSKTAKIISLDEVNREERALIPEEWIEIFNQDDIQIKIDKILNIWRRYVLKELSNTILYLKYNIKDIDLMRQEGKEGVIYSILYSIQSGEGKIMYYEGRVPILKLDNDALSQEWDRIPCSIKKFYENVHNGFYHYASMSMGLVPIKYVEFLGDEDMDWAIIDELQEPLQLCLETSFGFFVNGMGSYIVIDCQNCTNDNAIWWSAKEQPMYNVNFWDIVDEWIVIGFEK